MKQLLIILTLLLLHFNTQAQEGRRERIKSLKIAYLTEKLDLQPEEASAFWPVYNQYEDELYELKRALGKIQREIAGKDPSTLSESEAKSTLQDINDLKNKIATLENDFRAKVPGVLGPKGALYLDIHEELFKRELLKRLQERRASRRNE